MSNGLVADDRHQPWWDQAWYNQRHIIGNPVPSYWTGQGAAVVTHSTAMPQPYADYYPSSTTVMYAQAQAAFPGAIVGPAFPRMTPGFYGA